MRFTVARLRKKNRQKEEEQTERQQPGRRRLIERPDATEHAQRIEAAQSDDIDEQLALQVKRVPEGRRNIGQQDKAEPCRENRRQGDRADHEGGGEGDALGDRNGA
jgi:hypothetical protein